MFELSALQISWLFAAGALLGAFFFGGLWWTVRTLTDSKRPAVLFLSSLVIRTVVLLGGIYWIGEAQWYRYVVMLIGVLAARMFMVRYSRGSIRDATVDASEINHAP